MRDFQVFIVGRLAQLQVGLKKIPFAARDTQRQVAFAWQAFLKGTLAHLADRGVLLAAEGAMPNELRQRHKPLIARPSMAEQQAQETTHRQNSCALEHVT